MKRKYVRIIALMIAALTVLSGCGKSESASTADYAVQEAKGAASRGFDSSLGSFYADNDLDSYESADTAANSSMDSVGAEEASSEGAAVEGEAPEQPAAFEQQPEYDLGRKIVYTSNINIETKKFDDDVAAIKELVKSNGGYYENSSVTGTAEYGGRYANYVTRVPAANYQAFMDSVGQIGSVTSSNEYVDDITSDYVDVQARLRTLNTKLQRLEELEKNATTVEDLLAVEDRINNVVYEIESYTAKLKLYDDKIDFCTVTIELDEVVTYSEVKKDTAWNRFTEAFGDSISGFVSFLESLVIAIIYLFPYLIVIGIITLIVLKVTKKKRLERKRLAEERKAKALEKGKEDYKGPVYTQEKEEKKNS